MNGLLFTLKADLHWNNGTTPMHLSDGLPFKYQKYRMQEKKVQDSNFINNSNMCCLIYL